MVNLRFEDVRVGDRFIVQETALEISKWDDWWFEALVNETDLRTAGKPENFLGMLAEKGELATEESWGRCLDAMRARLS